MAFQLSSVPQFNYSTDYGNPAQSIASLGTAFQGAYDAAKKRGLQNQRLALLSELGNGPADYNSIGMKLASLGDVETGVSLMKMGQSQADSEADRELLKSIVPGGGSAVSPAGAPVPPMGGNASKAISSIESGGRYDATGPKTRTGDQAYGKYQVMGANVGPWTEQYVGRRMTPQEFLASPEAQEAVFRGEFGRLQQKHGPEGAARAWFAGEGGMNDPNRKDVLGTTVQAYGNKFARAYGNGGGADGETPVKVAQAGPMTLTDAVAANPRIQNLQRAYGLARSERARSIIKQQLDLELESVRSTIPRRLSPLDEEAKRLDIEQKRRNLLGEGATPLTPEERQAYGVPPDQPAYKTRSGEIKFGPRGTNVSVDQRGETEEAKSIGKAAGEAAGETLKAGAKAGATLYRLNRMGDLLDRVQTGKLAPAQMTIAQWGKALGLTDGALKGLGLSPDSVGSAEALQGLINQAVTGMIGAGGFPANNFSDADRKFLEKTFPELSKTPEGNRLILETLKISAERDKAKASAYAKWRKENKGSSFYDFESQWEDQTARGPSVLGGIAGKAERLIGATQGTPQGQPAAPLTGKTSSGLSWSIEP